MTISNKIIKSIHPFTYAMWSVGLSYIDWVRADLWVLREPTEFWQVCRNVEAPNSHPPFMWTPSNLLRGVLPVSHYKWRPSTNSLWKLEGNPRRPFHPKPNLPYFPTTQGTCSRHLVCNMRLWAICRALACREVVPWTWGCGPFDVHLHIEWLFLGHCRPPPRWCNFDKAMGTYTWRPSPKSKPIHLRYYDPWLLTPECMLRLVCDNYLILDLESMLLWWETWETR